MVNMTEEESSSSSITNQDAAFQLYVQLLGTLQHYHSRWVDNYKIFLSFNSFLLPAVTALLAYALKDGQDQVRLLVSLLCIIGGIAAWCGLGLLKRIQLDADFRVNQLCRLEDMMPNLPIQPFSEGYEYFFKKSFLPEPRRGKPLPSLRVGQKGIRAIDAYGMISRSVLLAYVLIFFYSIWPFILGNY